MNPPTPAVSPPRSLLLVSLGPVQSFIVTARKSSDLWFGSWLLSELARTAAGAAIDKGAALLIPDPGALQNEQQAGVPARLALRCPEGVDPKDVITAAELEMRRRLQGLFDAVMNRTNIERAAVYDTEARAQLDDLPELHWVSVPWAESTPFVGVMALADRLLTATKRHRPFKQPSWPSDRLKSSVDGARESVLNKEVMDKLRDEPQELWRRLRVRPGEHLCGPGLLKRWAPVAYDPAKLGEGARTMSTSHIASWSLRRAWQETDLPPAALDALKSAWDTYTKALRGINPDLDRTGVKDGDAVLGDDDGGLLYKSRLPDVLNTDKEPELAAAEAALNTLLDDWRKTLAQHDRPALGKVGGYYAVIVGDGDHLGKTLQALQSPEDVQALSTSLLTFAEAARGVAKDHHAQVVYIGGDDLLMLAPVETVMDCCVALNEAFGEQVSKTARRLKISLAPTLSVGVCVAHHLDPFQESVAAARDAETRAKTRGGRDAFAVTLRPRSGPPTEIVGRWARHETLLALRALFTNDRLPGGLPHDLRDAADAVPKDACEPPGEENAEAKRERLQNNKRLQELRVLEAKRVIAQKSLDDDDTTTTLKALLDDNVFDPRALADWLLVARRFAKNEEDRS